MRTSAQRIVQQLGLTSHPEGGWFRETYRATQSIDVNGQSRCASTGIYFLLESGQVSHLHRIDADELWHHYEGQCLRIHVFDQQGYRSLLLGPFGDGDAEPQHWVPAGAWFGAEVVAAEGYALVGCTVAPGFEFDSFELATEGQLLAEWPEQAALIQRMTARA